MHGHDASPPRNAIAAVTHPDPYPYYAALRRTSPLYYDEGLALWVASSAAMVTAVLTHPASRVRPADEPIPPVLLGSPAAEVFRHLVRMNDGSTHCPFKQAVTATLDGIDSTWLDATADDRAASLIADMDPHAEPSGLHDFAYTLPAHVVGTLLGFPEESLGEVAAWTNDLVRCLFPGGSPDQIERGKTAAARLLDLLGRTDAIPPFSLFHRLTDEAHRVGRNEAGLVAANAIGFLAQTYDATAALLCTTLLTLARQPALVAHLDGLIDEVLRFDAPVQNTRRFLDKDADIGGLQLPAGSTILVVLAAANRDPQANPDPDVLDVARPAPRVFTFGTGAHACPGRRVATSITRVAMSSLLARGLDPNRIDTCASYRPSANCRMPLISWKEKA